MRKKMGPFTIVLLIWLTLYVVFLSLNILGLLLSYDTVRVVEFALLCLVTILYALAIAGIVTHYYRGETASRLRWGPLCGIAGAAVYLGLAVVSTVYDPTTTPWSWLYIFVLSTGIPSYIEYLKEGAPAATARVTQSVLSGRLSSALTRYVEHIEVSIDRVRKRVRRDLTLLTVALFTLTVGLSIIFALSFLLPSAHIIDLHFLQDLHLQQLILAIAYVLFSVFFLILAVVFSSLVKKTHFVVLSVNHSDASLESDAAAERRTLVKDAHRRLVVFLLVYAIPIVALLKTASIYTDQLAMLLETSSVPEVALLLSVLACFLLGYRVLTQSSVAAIALDEPALHGLLEASIGILPTKVRVGEAHSVMMDFNIAAAGDVTSSARDPPTFNADLPRAHYELELQAAGATVDGEKRCAILGAPATLKGIWSCSFPRVGTQRLHLLLHSVRPARARTARDAVARELIFAYTHEVHVDRTASSENVISVIGVIVAAASVLTNLHWFIHF